MTLDGHIHIGGDAVDQEAFRQRLASAGIDGGLLISIAPPSFRQTCNLHAWPDRLSHLMDWVESRPDLYPFFWLDPLEDDALDQVAAAAQRSVAGFKVICDRFYPGAPRAMEVFRAVARAGKPILFHSGILWDGKDSARYNRPGEFEPLLEIDGLRFSLAHISWPWCDELIAVYGKFLNAYTRRPDLSVEMFIDTTPGTPVIYRREALSKVFGIGYDVEHNVVFGSDCVTDNYNAEWTREWIDRDTAILSDLGLGESVMRQVFGENFLRFVGAARAEVPRVLPRPAQ